MRKGVYDGSETGSLKGTDRGAGAQAASRTVRLRNGEVHRFGYEPGVFASLRDVLLTGGDYYMHLADLRSYLDADQRQVELYGDPDGWSRKAILNVAGSGKFSSDRTIAQYAAEIWNVEPCPVP